MAINTITLKEGDSFFVPKGAKILDVIDPDNIGLSSPSNCLDVTIPLKKCYRYNWEGVGSPSNYGDAFFTGMKIGNVSYNFNTVGLGATLTYDNGSSVLTEMVRLAPYITIVASSGIGGGGNSNKSVTIQIPDTVDAPVLFWQNLILAPSTIQYSSIIPIEIECPAV